MVKFRMPLLRECVFFFFFLNVFFFTNSKYCSLQDPSQKVDGEDIRGWLRQSLGGYQIPKKIIVVDELPKTSTGKVKKNVLRKNFVAAEQ